MILLRRHLNDMNEIVLRANIIFPRIFSSPFSTMSIMATLWSDVSAFTHLREAFSRFLARWLESPVGLRILSSSVPGLQNARRCIPPFGV